MDHPWIKDVKTCAQELHVDLAVGLDDAEVIKRRELHGPNELDEEEGRSFLKLVLEQFDDPLVKVLLGAAFVSTLLAVNELYESGETVSFDKFIDPVVILAILFLNASIGVWQESNAEKSLEALKEMQPDTATVLRNGKVCPNVPARDLVPGDVLLLEAGNKVPADCRLVKLETTTIRVEQMALTGESMTVSKKIEPIKERECEIQSKVSMLFGGTTIANGHCHALVTSTGMKTEIGKIQTQIQEAAELKEEDRTPLKKKLDEFSDRLQYMIGAVCVLVWLINVRMFFDFEKRSFNFKKALYYFNIAVALAVAAIPEGLPTVITLCLALGTRKMARRKAIVRKLPAVETLGCTTVICSDKTGTLTTNQMSVKRCVILAGSKEKFTGTKTYDFTGSSYDPTDGKFLGSCENEPSLQQLVKIAALCNESKITYDRKTRKFDHVGAPTEAALRCMVEKMLNINKSGINEDHPLPGNEIVSKEYKKVAVLEFTRDRKSMGVITNSGSNMANELLVKGAPENLLSRCDRILLANGSVIKLDDKLREQIMQDILSMAEKAWRVIGFAFSNDLGVLADYSGPSHKYHSKLTDPAKFAEVEKNLVYVGCCGMQDPPRPEVKASIASCTDAGIKVIVMTGDNKTTAESICKEIGVFTENEDFSKRSYLGQDFGKLNKAEQVAVLNQRGSILFSRCEPKFKQDVVKLLKEQGEVVAMTGDGVNDAPALRLADIGIAMGICGTQVAKEASDMVLADDNFATIVAAVEEGRAIYNNMKAFIRYMISSNLGEVACILFTSLLGLPEAFGSVQLLWVNFVTDGPPATALGFNPSDPAIMKLPPRHRSDQLISRWLLFRYAVIGMYVGCATVGIFIAYYMTSSFLGIEISNPNKPVSFEMLSHWINCDLKTGIFNLDSGVYKHQDCSMFVGVGKLKPATLSLSVLVTIEMLNALNALSEDQSLLVVKPWVNRYLLLAMAFSFGMHCLILYIPRFNAMFQVAPLTFQDWLLVFAFSSPVILIDEVLKFFGRRKAEAERRRLLAEKKEQ